MWGAYALEMGPPDSGLPSSCDPRTFVRPCDRVTAIGSFSSELLWAFPLQSCLPVLIIYLIISL